MNNDTKTYTRTAVLTPSEARDLEREGFVLELIHFGVEKDIYNVYTKDK